MHADSCQDAVQHAICGCPWRPALCLCGLTELQLACLFLPLLNKLGCSPRMLDSGPAQ